MVSMNMETRDAAAVLVQCKWLRDQIKRWEDAAREVLVDKALPGERVLALAPDGTVLGSVTRSEVPVSADVVNEAGLVEWVKERYPSEIVEAVTPAFRAILLAQAQARGGVLIDKDAEVCPYVEPAYGTSRVIPTLDKFADAVITQRILKVPLMQVISPESEQPACATRRRKGSARRNDNTTTPASSEANDKGRGEDSRR